MKLNAKNSDNIVRQVRDLTLIVVDEQNLMVIAVDSDGGIGELIHDTVYCGGYELGRFSIRVPLMEVLACGATPLTAFDLLTVPLNDYGQQIINGIRDELAAAGLGNDFPLSGSSEDNVPTTMTGVGTMVVGITRQSLFKPGKAKAGDQIFCIGIPKSAPHDMVKTNDPQIVQQQHLLILNKLSVVHDILPVGSGGIAYEATQLAEAAGLKAEINESGSLDLKKSGGPSTCVLVAAEINSEQLLKHRLSVPLNHIGHLVKR